MASKPSVAKLNYRGVGLTRKFNGPSLHGKSVNRFTEKKSTTLKRQESKSPEPKFKLPSMLNEEDIHAAPQSDSEDDNAGFRKPRVASDSSDDEADRRRADIPKSGFGTGKKSDIAVKASDSSRGPNKVDDKRRMDSISPLMEVKRGGAAMKQSADETIKSSNYTDDTGFVRSSQGKRRQKVYSRTSSFKGSQKTERSPEATFKRPPVLSQSSGEDSLPKKLKLSGTTPKKRPGFKSYQHILEDVRSPSTSPGKKEFSRPPITSSPLSDFNDFMVPAALEALGDDSFNESELPEDPFADSSLPRLVKKRSHEDSPQSQHPAFRLPADMDQLFPKDAYDSLSQSDVPSSSRNALLSLDINQTLPMSSQPEELLEIEFKSATIITVPCPICGMAVAKELLTNFSRGQRMNTSKQVNFCRHHKRHTAFDAYEAAGYPKIDWAMLDKRINKHHNFIQSVLEGKSKSYYRDVFVESVKTGKGSRNIRQELYSTKSRDASGKATQSLVPGYYGTRGLRAISENILHKFSSKLNEAAIEDRMVSARGAPAYLQGVIVPEIATRLICDDLGVEMEEARIVLGESAALGEAVNEEVEEVVLITENSLDDADDEYDY